MLPAQKISQRQQASTVPGLRYQSPSVSPILRQRIEHNVTHSFNKLETFLNNQLVPGTLRRNIVPGRTFRRGEPGLDVRSRSLLAMEAKSLRSAVRLGGELSDEAFRLRPRYFRGAMGLGFGLGFCFGLNTMSLSSSELMSKTKRFVSKKTHTAAPHGSKRSIYR